MTEKRLTLGKWGEEAAAVFLRKRRMKILARNFRTPVGEIDIIARQGKTLVFVEVKTRSSDRFGLPQEAVGPAKQRQILRAAQWYIGEGHGKGLQPRFDVIAVRTGDNQPEIEHIVNAFSG